MSCTAVASNATDPADMSSSAVIADARDEGMGEVAMARRSLDGH